MRPRDSFEHQVFTLPVCKTTPRQTETDPMADLLTRADAAALVGVSVSTWSAYVARGQAPAPTRRLYGKPLWSRTVVTEWRDNRPGQGAKDTRRAHERALAQGITRDEAAERVGISPRTWSAWVRDGRAPGPIGKRGRADVWRAEAVARLAQQHGRCAE